MVGGLSSSCTYVILQVEAFPQVSGLFLVGDYLPGRCLPVVGRCIDPACCHWSAVRKTVAS